MKVNIYDAHFVTQRPNLRTARVIHALDSFFTHQCRGPGAKGGGEPEPELWDRAYW